MANKDRVRRYRAKDPEKCNAMFRANWRRKKEAVDAYLACRSCARCGEDDPRLLDFHHRDRTTKKFCIRHCGGRSLEVIFREIRKCDILCANCHRLVEHHGETY